jgi:geranylgeranyl reductase family protein
MEDLVIVGAGFAGLACARAAALRGLRVCVLERKRAIGVRTHTTGIVVKEAAEAWDLPLRLTRRIAGVRLYAPDLRAIDLESPGYYFLATDTPALMRWLARSAQHAGVRIVAGAPFLGAERTHETWRLTGFPTLSARFLVGADGPRSAVATRLGLRANREFLLGVEVELEDVRGVDPDRLHCFLDSRLAPGYIGWVVPGVGGRTQVGLACRQPHRPDLWAFVRKLGRRFDFDAARIVERRGGLIPVGGPVHPAYAPGALLVGDAAGLVSPLTAGGIHAALDSGHRAAHAIADHLLYLGPEPGRVMARAAPGGACKRLARRAFDLGVPDAVWNAALGSMPMRIAARLIYFHKRGALSSDAWRDVVREEFRVTPT